MKISAKPGAKRTVYGWVVDGVYFLSPFSSLMTERPKNAYSAKKDAEAEAVARNCVIEWENVLDG